MLLNTVLVRQRQGDICEFEASLDFRTSSRRGFKATEKPCLKKEKERKGKERK